VVLAVLLRMILKKRQRAKQDAWQRRSSRNYQGESASDGMATEVDDDESVTQGMVADQQDDQKH
jgi:hypothetical protein